MLAAVCYGQVFFSLSYREVSVRTFFVQLVLIQNKKIGCIPFHNILLEIITF